MCSDVSGDKDHTLEVVYEIEEQEGNQALLNRVFDWLLTEESENDLQESLKKKCA